RLEAVSTPDIEWLQALERVHDDLHRVWSPVSHLNSVASSPALREVFNRCLPLITEFNSELGQNEALFRQFERMREALPAGRIVETELVSQTLRDFRLAGVALPPADKERFRNVKQALAAREAQFEQNLMDASDAFEHHETRAEALAGLPEVVFERAREAAAKKGLEGWLLPLDMPTYLAVMSNARSAELRELFYEAWVTRASDQGPLAGRWDNGPLMVEILALRHEAARLLGFDHFAELSLATKMAESPETVLAFLGDLAQRGRPLADRDLAELEACACRKLDAWDVAYFSEQLRRRRFALDQEELRPYFPLPKVLEGLFSLAERLFGLVLTARPAAGLWHPSVRFYDIERRRGGHVGGLFVDLFARPNKRGGAWMDGCFDRARLPGRRQDPVAHLVCNFNPPSGGKPSLLTHGEVVTLFHEFGHTLHHLLTQVDYPSLAGINGVAWDAVELPSQFFENYAWLPEVLRTISAHIETGEQLPEDKIAVLNRSRKFLAGLSMLRQLEFALFDFRLHSEPEPASLERTYRILEEVRREVAVIAPPGYNRFPHGFAHVFGGGYAAGYYSYKWAEVLAADAFAAFEESGPFDAATARRFEQAVLAVGGSRPALDAFVAFRGRAPELGPLLAQAGIPAES
ncbi:MAG TPA: M3 family metallopeptidase, partial [Gammaproteobacteria bacterium]|nr:M3 family metallopeptidase [Gammaproteobacteria bacterium]